MGGADFRAVVQKKLSVNLIIFIEKEMDYAAADTDIIHRPEARPDAVQSGQIKHTALFQIFSNSFRRCHTDSSRPLSLHLFYHIPKEIFTSIPLPLLLCPPGFSLPYPDG